MAKVQDQQVVPTDVLLRRYQRLNKWYRVSSLIAWPLFVLMIVMCVLLITFAPIIVAVNFIWGTPYGWLADARLRARRRCVERKICVRCGGALQTAVPGQLACEGCGEKFAMLEETA